MSLCIIENPKVFRAKIRVRLDKLINNSTNTNNLEKGVYNYSLKEADRLKVVKKWDNTKFVRIYVDRLRSVFINLSNTDIAERLTNGDIKAQDIAFLSHQEMAPGQWSELINQKMIKDKYKFEMNVQSATDTFTCRKCHKNQCTYYQQQTRSADEPMTTFVQCINCDNRWKC
jgi:transcription elongation factor S-II